MFPVDVPADAASLTLASQRYLASLKSTPTDAEWFESSQTSKVKISSSNVRSLQLFEDVSVATLHLPDDPQQQVVALWLHEKWWSVDDVLRTSNELRRGLVSVQSMVERLIVFLLSGVVDRCVQEEALFLPHPCTERLKLLWSEGEAVGFYSVKHKGSLCDDWSARCYLLPVLDTVLVRRSRRRRGFGLKMLQDFCSSFTTEEFLGLSAPLSVSMLAVCRTFLQQHHEHQERLYEVEAPGEWNQRRNVWINIQLRDGSTGGTGDTEDTLDTEDTEDIEDTGDTEGTGDSEDTEDILDTEDTRGTEDTEDTEDDHHQSNQNLIK